MLPNSWAKLGSHDVALGGAADAISHEPGRQELRRQVEDKTAPKTLVNNMRCL